MAVDPDAVAHEERQYALMRARIAALRSGKADIGNVIADLEGLLNALEHAPQAWKDRFVGEWSALETAFAVALDRRGPLPAAASDPQVGNALDALDDLIDERSPHRT